MHELGNYLCASYKIIQGATSHKLRKTGSSTAMVERRYCQEIGTGYRAFVASYNASLESIGLKLWWFLHLQGLLQQTYQTTPARESFEV